jgi:hypothetical protein
MYWQNTLGNSASLAVSGSQEVQHSLQASTLQQLGRAQLAASKAAC